MQLHIKHSHSQIMNQICTAYHQQSKRFSDKCWLPIQYLNRVFKKSNKLYQLQQQCTIILSVKSIANHLISSTNQSSVRQCSSALAYISDIISIPAMHTIHNNLLDLDLANLL